MTSLPSILIAGCGYVGQALARRALAAGHDVLGLCQRPESAAALTESGIPARAADLTSQASLAEVTRAWPEDTLVVHCAASGKGGGSDAYRAVYLEGMRRLREAFPAAGRVLFTSSTSVYPQIDGSVVSESSPAEPERETGRILRQTESETLEAGGTVVRLAGLYGPGRSVLLRNFLTGAAVIDVRTEPPPTPDGRWINQIHRDDAASALLFVLTQLSREECSGSIFNATDSTPMLQRTVYSELSERFGRPLPPEAAPDHTRKRGWTHKRVDTSRLLSLGWSPAYPSWFDALDRDQDLVPSIVCTIAPVAP